MLLLNCEKEDALSTENLVSLQKISTVNAMENLNEQKVAYRLLNSNEKYTLWKTKFSKAISEESNFTKQQVKLLNELNNKLTVALFENESNEKEYFKNIYTPNLLKQILSEFAREQIFELFFSISSNITKKYVAPSGGCECNVGSIVSCGFGSDDCDDSSCNIGNGCGFLWAYDCDGMC